MELLFPQELSREQINLVYASEADLLNMALFGKTVAEWRIKPEVAKSYE